MEAAAATGGGVPSSSGSGGDVVKTRPVGCKTIFVKNLPYDVTEADIKASFQVCGPIQHIRLATWAHTGSLKGFGYIEFKREDSAEIAGWLTFKL